MKSKFAKNCLNILAYLTVLPVSIFFLINVMIIVGMRAANFAEHYRKIKVEGEPSQWFPVAVLRPKNNILENREIDVIFFADKDRYFQDNPQATFLLPTQDEEILNESLKERCGNDEFYPTDLNPFCYSQKYRILESDGKSQFVKATYETDYDYVNNGWYKTDGKEIIPLEHQHYFGPGVSIGLLIFSFYLSLGIYSGTTIFILVRYFRRKGRVLSGDG